MADGSEAAALVRSMTGFGSATLADARWQLDVEIRGANHRHFLLKASLPSFLQALEAEADTALRRRIDRGSLGLRVTCRPRQETPPARFDAALARRYLAELEALAGELGVAERPSFADLLALPGVVTAVADEPTAVDLREIFGLALDTALAAFVASREREGRALAADVGLRVAEIGALLDAVEERWPQLLTDHRNRLEQRVRDFLAEHGHRVSEVELLREVAIYADRSDVAEEIARLRTHLAEVMRRLAVGGSVGRQLEFLAQEMLREANTIGSKVADAAVAHVVVDMKTALDRIREQVQNIE